MASYKEHCADCKKELGKDWSVVHIWLDELFRYFGSQHRSFRHHKLGVNEVRAKWGDEAAKAAEIHIKKDFFGKVPEDAFEVEMIMDGVIHIPGNQENQALNDGAGEAAQNKDGGKDVGL